MGQTIVQKIIAKHCDRSEVQPGEIVYPRFDLAVIHGVPLPEFWAELEAIGVEKIAFPERMIVMTDHRCPVVTVDQANRSRKARALVSQLKIGRFVGLGRHGIQHQYIIEQGYALPGMLIVIMDPHSLNLGAVGCIPISVVYEFPTVMATGTIWLRVPETIRIRLEGKKQFGVGVRDISHFVINKVGAEAADYRVLEFTGPAVKAMSVSERIILCGVSAEIGSKSAVIEPDETTLQYVRDKAKSQYEVVRNDPDPHFAKEYEFDISLIEPMVAAPPSPDNAVPLRNVAGKRIDSAYIGSCASGTLEELRDVAKVLKDRQIHPEVNCVIVPSTQDIFAQAAEEGLITIFIKAGCHILGPTCGPCGGNMFQMGDGEVRIGTGTRNDRGRAGSFDSEMYLASAVTVAASAVKGAIADPREFLTS